MRKRRTAPRSIAIVMITLVSLGLLSSPGATEPPAGDAAAEVTSVAHPTELYTGLPPCRMIDTRIAGGPFTSVRHFQAQGNLTSQGGAVDCGVPAGATGIAINITAVNTSDGAGGYVRGWPFLVWTSLDATLLNYGGPFNMSNMVNLQLCQQTCPYDFDLAAYGSPVDLVVDVIGYYRANAFATIAANGTVGASSGVVVALRQAPGTYVINFNRDVDSCAADVTGTDVSSPRTYRVGPTFGTPYSLQIYAKDLTGALADGGFNIRIRC